MIKRKILYIIIAILVLIITFEFISLFIIKSDKINPNNANSSTNTKPALILEEDIPLSAADLTAFPEPPTSTPIPEMETAVKDTVQRIYDIMHSTSYITKNTKLIQEYVGKITDIDNTKEEIFIPSHGETYTISLKIALQSGNETPKIFYYSDETVKKIVVYDINNNKTSINSIQLGDLVKYNVVYEVSTFPAVPERIEITKLN